MSKCRLCSRPVAGLLLVIAVMFALGLALTPAYEKARRAFGFQHAPSQDRAQEVDYTRQVRVHFKAANAVDMAWGFYPKQQQIDVHPGAVLPQDRMFLLHSAGAHARSAHRDAHAFHY